jgi:hypothetical protein
MPRRRGLIATAISGGVAWISGHAAFLPGGGRQRRSALSPGGLAAFLSDLCYSGTIGNACLEALPGSENSKDALAREILGDLRKAEQNDASARGLARLISQRIRNDFHEGRIMTVDGWILSLTETRVHALAALLPQSQENVDKMSSFPPEQS